MRCLSPYLILFVSGAIGCQSVRLAEHPTSPHFRIITYNVSCSEAQPAKAVEILRETDADIVCLQETTPESESYFRQQLGDKYPCIQFHGAGLRAAGGLGFLSKLRCSEVAFIPTDTTWFDAWIMSFQTDIGRVQVLNVHLRPPVNEYGSVSLSGLLSTDRDRLREMERFFARRDPVLPLVIAGDFNDNENTRVMRWLRAHGMLDALSEFDRHTPTWRWRKGLLSLNRRMDHIVYPPALYCYEARVIKAGTSDHYPVEAVFGLKLTVP